jgi:hypothetical protein
MEEKYWREWADALNEEITSWLNEEAKKTEEGYFCKLCGEQLMARTVHCSIHDGYKFFKDCVGSGRVYTFKIPECPNEKCPNHRPNFWNKYLRLDGDTLRGPCIDC